MERKAVVISKAVVQNPFTTVRCDKILLDEAYFIINAKFQKEGKEKLTRESVIELALRSYLTEKDFK